MLMDFFCSYKKLITQTVKVGFYEKVRAIPSQKRVILFSTKYQYYQYKTFVPGVQNLCTCGTEVLYCVV